MIQIEDNDMPIQVAEKIISGTKDRPTTTLDKAVCRTFSEKNLEDVLSVDMFDLEEIKEIADYLMVYYQSHMNGD